MEIVRSLISIHALHEESDMAEMLFNNTDTDFNPRSP